MIYKNPIIIENRQEAIVRENSITKNIVKSIILRKF